MRRASIYLIIFLISGLWLGSAEAQRGRGGGGGRAGGISGGGGISRGGGDMQPRVQNRSTGNFNSANINRGNISSSNVDRTNINSANVNRNVTNVNRNVNVDRDVDVHGGYWHGGYSDDPGWGWGSFAAGAAAGATTAAVGAAAAGHHDTVVVPPPTGTVVATLPPSCTMVGTSGTALYDCGGAYYRPYYSGSNLVYEAVQNP
jgi:hypothetical protein